MRPVEDHLNTPCHQSPGHAEAAGRDSAETPRCYRLGRRPGPAPAPVSVAGVDGWMIDVNSSVPAECTEPPWIFLWELPTVGDFHLADDEQARFILLDAGDRTIAIVAESYPGSDHVGLLELTDAILATMTITP